MLKTAFLFGLLAVSVFARSQAMTIVEPRGNPLAIESVCLHSWPVVIHARVPIFGLVRIPEGRLRLSVFGGSDPKAPTLGVFGGYQIGAVVAGVDYREQTGLRPRPAFFFGLQF